MALTLTPDDIIAIHGAIYIDVRDGADTNPGTPTEPVQTVIAARAAANAAGIKEYRIRGAITLDDDHDRWTVRGLSAGFLDEVNLAGFSVDESLFQSLKLAGACDNSQVEAQKCQLSLVSGAYGIFTECGLINTFFVDNDRGARTFLFERCYSTVAGLERPIFDFASLATDDPFAHNFMLRGWIGGGVFRNIYAEHKLSIDVHGATIEFEDTCVAGEAVMRGYGEDIDNSNGLALTDFLLHGTDLKLARRLLQNETTTDPETGKMTVLDDDGTPLVEAPIFQDAAGLTPYSNTSLKIERRGRLE